MRVLAGAGFSRETPMQRWFRDVRTNLYGSFLCCRAVVKRMVERGRGYAINIVSSGGVGDPHPNPTGVAVMRQAWADTATGRAFQK